MHFTGRYGVMRPHLVAGEAEKSILAVRPPGSPAPAQPAHLHLAKPGLVVMAPGQAGGSLAPLQGLLHLFGSQEHLDVH